ncbi:twin-arginine translocase subunit TatC [Ruficoccus amylovorans]|uniref:Sec-independent protein translocase protein TatC n=1 Tax=Ruficoccus amylovorans TaxID=1804625 RepID=A0A842HGP1_9BACT|nr:twin-arginine translocase subunit TatC [Ruficoccus amylovorans]MBC2594724.1 twin-arginine translocase subunit TatC [Ruficoccus amylovorans]
MMDEPENVNEAAEDSQEREPGTMGLLDHLEELRWAVLRSMSAVLAGVVITAFFFPSFFSVLRYPLDRAIANEPSGLVALTTTSVMGVFMVIIQVCMIGGVALGLPFVLYNFSRFVAPGLTQKEKRVLIPACACTLLLFLFGCLFAYFVVLPTGLEVTLYLNKKLGLGIIWTAQSYYNLVIWLMIGVGLAFEFPLVLVILQYIGVVTPGQLREYRRFSVVGILIAAALITPGGDPITMLMLASVLYLFFESAILVGDRLVKKREAEMAEYLDED